MNYFDNTNLAYDLSRFDVEERERRNRERKAQAPKILMAPQASVAKSGSKLKLVAVVAAFFAALFTVAYFNVKSDDVARMVAKEQTRMETAKDDNVMLQSKLDFVANTGYIEKYAVENLGMTKVTSTQKQYKSFNTESLIEVEKDDSAGFIGSVKRWFNSVVEYIGL